MTLRLIAGNIISWVYNSYLGRQPVHGLRIGFLKAYLDQLGTDCKIGPRCRIWNGRKITIGDRTHLNEGCVLDGRIYQIRIGSDVSIGPEATILTLGHDPQSPDFADKGGEVVVGDRAWIAYRAIILPGVTIGEGAVVGAGAVVTKDVAPFTIVAGSPAKVVGHRNRELVYKL